MTDEEIDQMEAGPEMDALVAEFMIGWRRAPSEDDPAGWCWVTEHGRTRGSATALMPTYSTNIAAAWQVVEKLKERFSSVLVETNPRQYYVDIVTDKGTPSYYRTVADAEADTAPLAICRAALKAVNQGSQ